MVAKVGSSSLYYNQIYGFQQNPVPAQRPAKPNPAAPGNASTPETDKPDAKPTGSPPAKPKGKGGLDKGGSTTGSGAPGPKPAEGSTTVSGTPAKKEAGKLQDKQAANANNAANDSEPDTYPVVDGDSLWRISKRYDIPMSKLYELNPQFDPKLADNRFNHRSRIANRREFGKWDPDFIRPDDKINLPAGTLAAYAARKKGAAAQPSQPGRVEASPQPPGQGAGAPKPGATEQQGPPKQQVGNDPNTGKTGAPTATGGEVKQSGEVANPEGVTEAETQRKALLETMDKLPAFFSAHNGKTLANDVVRELEQYDKYIKLAPPDSDLRRKLLDDIHAQRDRISFEAFNQLAKMEDPEAIRDKMDSLGREIDQLAKGTPSQLTADCLTLQLYALNARFLQIGGQVSESDVKNWSAQLDALHQRAMPPYGQSHASREPAGQNDTPAAPQ